MTRSVKKKKRVPTVAAAPAFTWQKRLSYAPYLILIVIAPAMIWFHLPWIALVACAISFVLILKYVDGIAWLPLLIWTAIFILLAMKMIVS